MFSLVDFKTKLNLVMVFKEKHPQTFVEAFQIAAESGMKGITHKIICEALEIYVEDKQFSKEG